MAYISPYRTLGQLRAILQARCGMGGMGASGANQTLLNSFLTNGQAQLYRLQNWKHITDYQDKTLGVGQNQIDYPVAGALSGGALTATRDRRVLKLESPQNGQYIPIKEGITTEMWSTMDTPSWPARFERYAQILIYPKADQIYTVRVWFIADLLPFSEDGHFATLDDEMILLHALANAKAHYRQPDARTYQGQLDALLGALRGQSFTTDSVVRRTDEAPIERKPVVI